MSLGHLIPLLLRFKFPAWSDSEYDVVFFISHGTHDCGDSRDSLLQCLERTPQMLHSWAGCAQSWLSLVNAGYFHVERGPTMWSRLPCMHHWPTRETRRVSYSGVTRYCTPYAYGVYKTSVHMVRAGARQGSVATDEKKWRPAWRSNDESCLVRSELNEDGMILVH
jgi:hypothetical protein